HSVMVDRTTDVLRVKLSQPGSVADQLHDLDTVSQRLIR
ncbi:MAG: hypothetical protein ACI89G_000854, partial [Minisyncoccia bacterium]